MKTTNSNYAHALANLEDGSATIERVEVNQRALIDKILARYASANATYRELVQNSNDADATVAEIYFTTSAQTESDVLMDDTSPSLVSSKPKAFGREIVRQVEYRNNGMPFRNQDWRRLKSIAEGNPDESKIGAFGVGAYTMFSICECPLVLSGNQALAFVWNGDALYTRTINNYDRPKEDEAWTSFVLPSRDPYPLPSLETFGEFLCSSLTFTKSLSEIRVFVNGKKRLAIHKTQIQEPMPVEIKKNSGWFTKDGAVLNSPSGLFSLKDEQSLLESFYHVQVELDGDTAAMTARYLSAIAKTKIPPMMVARMERVMKKKPPAKLDVQLFLRNQVSEDSPTSSKANRIVQSFVPTEEGKIFIGFRTSQTTGVAAHLAAPFVPTVEREQIDTQDPTLRIFNLELLHFAGIVARLALENGMKVLSIEYQKGTEERKRLEERLLKEAEQKLNQNKNANSVIAEQVRSEENGNDVDEEWLSGESTTTTKSLFGFAKFMARGVKRTIKTVVNNVADLVLDDGGELINPLDPRPLCREEQQAILLMQAFCPRQSTPDSLVGTAFAEGFSQCLDQAPPVLTRSGVVPGNLAFLPSRGIEAFVEDGVIRSIVYENAKEYFDVVALSRKLNLVDLTQCLSTKILPEAKVVRLLKWWVKYERIERSITTIHGVQLKEAVKYFADASEHGENTPSVLHLKDFLFYVDKERLHLGSGLRDGNLPFPLTVLPRSLQSKVGDRVLSEEALRVWFSPLPIEMWVQFISQHPCITSGQPEWETMRLDVFSIIAQEYNQRNAREQRSFASLCENVLSDKRCVPFDSIEPLPYSADVPSNLYLSSAELKTFDGMGNFHKVSQTLKRTGMTDEFLLQLGVRQSVSVDFLFANLDQLKWSNDPKALIEYLRSAKLTRNDMEKLKGTRYLPAENDTDTMFAPSELYLPDASMRIFPFVKILQWPSDDDVTERSQNGNFLVSIGMNVLPPLQEVLTYISNTVRDDEIRVCCLDFVAKRLGSGGSYQVQYSRLSRSEKANFKIIPCVRKSPLSGEEQRGCYSVLSCCSESRVAVMGFPVVDLGGKTKLYGNLFQCAEEPDTSALIDQLKILVNLSKQTYKAASQQQKQIFCDKVLASFAAIFQYLSTREFPHHALRNLENESFIPCLVDKTLQWYTPTMVFFNNGNTKEERSDDLDGITNSLFPTVPFSPFLSSTGVKQEATTKDLFSLIIQSPQAAYDAIKSEKRYRTLLRRIAAHRPFHRVDNAIRETPFLLAYTVSEDGDGKEKTTCELAKASDIYIIDNTFFGRMFSVKRAPHESDLEEFYALIGARYISEVVHKKFDIIGRPHKSGITDALTERIQERGPLLVSPSVTSRPLVENAASILLPSNFAVLQVDEITVVYKLQKSVRTNNTTCCSQQGRFGRDNAVVITPDFEFFDVGYAIAELILKHPNLTDAFFISSLLEAPLDQLRARGFPVDRIIKVHEPTKTNPEEPETPTIAAEKGDNNETTPSTPSNHSSDNTQNQNHQGRQVLNGSPAPLAASKDKEEEGAKTKTFKDTYVSILKQMFPGADEAFIAQLLGDNPNMNKVKQVAEDLAVNGYPEKADAKDDASTVTTQQEEVEQERSRPSKLLGSKKLSRAFNGLKSGKNLGGLQNRLKQTGAISFGNEAGMAAPPTGDSQAPQAPVQPKDDATLQENMEKALREKVKSSPSVDERGLKTPEQSISIPEGLDHGSSCEVLPSQDIKPFVALNGKTTSHNGIKIFSYAKLSSSEEHLQAHFDAVECFAVVLERLCTVVFGLPLHSVAIYHDPTGTAIAFNSGGALYFNFRYFESLHFSHNHGDSRECYSYWFVVCCHELAHNLAKAHDRNHGFYTESYSIMYMPKLMDLLSSMQS